MQLRFRATVIEWRGPAPFFYAPIPMEQADGVRRAAKVASYGWGVVPVEVTIAGVTFTTSLFPREGTYLLPLKDAVRRKIRVTVGDEVSVVMRIAVRFE